jgi:hypothetical protein
MSADTGEEQKPNDEGEDKARVNAQDARLALAQKIIGRLKEELAGLERLLSSRSETADFEDLVKRSDTAEGEMLSPGNESRVLEGVFDGQNMVGSDGRQYAVPPNYASKSKLVEGDILKLTIQNNGTFMFKQIGPIERQRVVGSLTRDEVTSDWRVVAVGKKFNVLTAAVSYHKGEVGDDAVILIPKAAPSKWAALENVIKRT